MPFHIDTDGTRRRYSFQVQQGFGGNSGDDGLVPLTRLPPAIATDDELAATLAAHVDPLTDPHRQYINVSQKGAPNGVATLGENGLVPLTQLPPDIATDAALAATLAAHVDPGGDPHRQYITAAKLAAALAGQRGRTYFISQI